MRKTLHTSYSGTFVPDLFSYRYFISLYVSFVTTILCSCNTQTQPAKEQSSGNTFLWKAKFTDNSDSLVFESLTPNMLFKSGSNIIYASEYGSLASEINATKMNANLSEFKYALIDYLAFSGTLSKLDSGKVAKYGTYTYPVIVQAKITDGNKSYERIFLCDLTWSCMVKKGQLLDSTIYKIPFDFTSLEVKLSFDSWEQFDSTDEGKRMSALLNAHSKLQKEKVQY